MREEQLLLLFPLIKSSKKPKFSVSLTTLVYKRIFQYVALVFLYGFFWPMSTVCYEGLYWSLNYLLDYSVRAYLLTKKKNIPRAQMISFPSQINVRCLSFKSCSRKARIYHLDLRKCLAFRLSSTAP